LFVPTNEQGVIYLFSRYHEKLGFEKMLYIGTRFPDVIAMRDGMETEDGQEINPLAIRYCWICGLPITKRISNRGFDYCIKHHISFSPEVTVYTHMLCHRFLHNNMSAKSPEYIIDECRRRFINKSRYGTINPPDPNPHPRKVYYRRKNDQEWWKRLIIQGAGLEDDRKVDYR